jgi:hypothetical protein
MKKNLIRICLLLLLSSCATNKITIEQLQKKNQLYAIKNNNFYYFMIDSLNNKCLVRTSFMNSSKVIWIEKLNRK